MLRVIARRVAIAVPLLLAVATVTFFIVNVLPGDVAQTVLGEEATAEQLARVRAELGLDQPLLVQFWDWLVNAAQGDLGSSLITGLDVTTQLNQRLPVTLSLALGATIVSALVGIALGVLSAVRGGATDKSARTITSVAMAIPGFWLAGLLVLAFAVGMGLFPATGYTSPTTSVGGWLKSMALPVTAVSLASIAGIARQARGAMLQVQSSDYIRTLRATGVPRRTIILKHGLRNAGIPVVTILGLEFATVLSSAVIVEQVFALPGISQLVLGAVFDRDVPVILGVVVYAALIVLIVNLLIDLCYLWLNPKERHS